MTNALIETIVVRRKSARVPIHVQKARQTNLETIENLVLDRLVNPKRELEKYLNDLGGDIRNSSEQAEELERAHGLRLVAIDAPNWEFNVERWRFELSSEVCDALQLPHGSLCAALCVNDVALRVRVQGTFSYKNERDDLHQVIEQFGELLTALALKQSEELTHLISRFTASS